MRTMSCWRSGRMGRRALEGRDVVREGRRSRRGIMVRRWGLLGWRGELQVISSKMARETLIAVRLRSQCINACFPF